MRNYTVKLYHMGTLIRTHRHLTYSDVYKIYNFYNPFTTMCVDIYENGRRIKFGRAITMFADRSVPM